MVYLITYFLATSAYISSQLSGNTRPFAPASICHSSPHASLSCLLRSPLPFPCSSACFLVMGPTQEWCTAASSCALPPLLLFTSPPLPPLPPLPSPPIPSPPLTPAVSAASGLRRLQLSGGAARGPPSSIVRGTVGGQGSGRGGSGGCCRCCCCCCCCCLGRGQG